MERPTAARRGTPAIKAFCDELEAGASADEETTLRSGQACLCRHRANHLVDGIVTTHVLSQDQQVSFRVEESGRVDSSRLFECGLLLTQRPRKRVERRCAGIAGNPRLGFEARRGATGRPTPCRRPRSSTSCRSAA